MARWHSCNVLAASRDGFRLWNFAAVGDGFKLTREEHALPGTRLNAKLIQKDWQTLVRKRLDLAWLPPEKVFLRVVQLPVDTPDELPSMIEFQLEKLSPMPVAQVVWTFEVLPQRNENLASIVIAIAERRAVEELLGQLETQGYMADRLELPFFDQLRATPVTEDGLWIYAATGTESCLVGWMAGGMLQNLTVLHLPATAPGKFLAGQVSQMAWAGEFEGWLKGTPRWNLVVDQPRADAWLGILKEGTDQPVNVVTPLAGAELAQASALRAAGDDTRRNFIPPEYLTRYRQQVVDRTWMQALAGAVVLYIFGVLIYFGAVEVLRFQVNKLKAETDGKAAGYQDALRARAEVGVLESQVKLQYAALDCWRTAVDLLPEVLQLESFNFSQGRRLSLSGTAPQESLAAVNEYHAALLKATDTNGVLMFKKVDQRATTLRGDKYSWAIETEVRLGGVE